MTPPKAKKTYAAPSFRRLDAGSPKGVLETRAAQADAGAKTMLDVIVHFKDKISKKLYPWRYAFWIYMGTRFEKWQGVPAKRQAYEKLLGPTLAEELQN